MFPEGRRTRLVDVLIREQHAATEPNRFDPDLRPRGELHIRFTEPGEGKMVRSLLRPRAHCAKYKSRPTGNTSQSGAIRSERSLLSAARLHAIHVCAVVALQTDHHQAKRTTR